MKRIDGMMTMTFASGGVPLKSSLIRERSKVFGMPVKHSVFDIAANRETALTGFFAARALWPLVLWLGDQCGIEGKLHLEKALRDHTESKLGVPKGMVKK